MREENLRQGVIKGFFWKAVESGGDQLITFVISIVLARLLGPEKYGTMSVMLIFVTLANVLIQTGFQTALIQKKEVSEDDFFSVTVLGLLLSAVLYLLIFLGAPAVATYFEDPAITSMLRVLSLILFSGAVTSVLFAKVARDMNFRLQCLSTIAADLLSGILGIIAALMGAGTWALVLQQLLKNIILMIVLSALMKYVPRGQFDGKGLKDLFAFGWKVLVSGMIDTVYNNLYTPVIQKLYDPAMVGLYNRANQFPQVIAQAAASTMQSVLLPAFSKTQGGEAEKKEESRSLMRRSLKVGSFLMFPAMFGIMAVSRSMVRVILGEDWMGAVPLLRLCCLSFSVWHIHVTNLQAINASGRSDIYLRLEVIKKVIGVLVLLLSARYGVTVMIFMKALFDYVCTFINGAPNRKILGYSPFRQWKDMLPEFAAAAVMGVLAYAVELLLARFGLGTDTAGSALLVMILQIITGAVSYFAIAFLFKMESFRSLLSTGKNFLGIGK